MTIDKCTISNKKSWTKSVAVLIGTLILLGSVCWVALEKYGAFKGNHEMYADLTSPNC